MKETISNLWGKIRGYLYPSTLGCLVCNEKCMASMKYGDFDVITVGCRKRQGKNVCCEVHFDKDWETTASIGPIEFIPNGVVIDFREKATDEL